MSVEHLFIGVEDPLDPGSMRQRAIRFCRKPGALDLLFNKISATDVPAEVVLVVTEILIFYGQYHIAGDELIAAPAAAANADRILRRGAFARLDEQFDAPIGRVLGYAIDKALNRTPPQRPTEEWWTK